MLLTPRYGTRPVLELDGDPGAIGDTLVRQRRRLVEMTRGLTDEQWAHASRCEGWTVRHVAGHLSTTNFFWETTIRAGRSGEPTRSLTNFDPVASPAQAAEELTASPSEIVDTLSTTTESLAACVAELTEADWSDLAESPPGHVSIDCVAHHALWDSWIHERDVMLPLGLAPREEDDEVIACLRYVAGLTPALALNSGGTQTGGFDVVASEPDVAFHVDIGSEVAVTGGAADAEFALHGDAVELVEALSFRLPLRQEIPSTIAWAFTGLATVFDR